MSVQSDAIAGLTTTRNAFIAAIAAAATTTGDLVTGVTAAIDAERAGAKSPNTLAVIGDQLSLKQFNEDLCVLLVKLGLQDVITPENAMRAHFRLHEADTWVSRWTARFTAHITG